MGGGELWIQLIRHPTRIAAVLKRRRLFRNGAFLEEGFAETGVGQSVVSVQLEGMLENLDSVVQILLAVVVLEVANALEIVVIRAGNLRSVSFTCSMFSRTSAHAKHFKDSANDRILNVESVVVTQGETVGAELPPGARFDEDEVDTDLPASCV